MNMALETEQVALVESLLTPQAYPHAVSRLRKLETHVSHLFFTGETVYKIKKPVDLGFLDFTTLEKRRHYCDREVELNRRISPRIYLGVVPISFEAGRYLVEGRGTPVEYAVKMKQLPSHRALSELLRHDQVGKREIEAVAALIARFHARAPTSLAITRRGDLRTIRRNIRENFAQTRPCVSTLLTRDEFDDLKAYSRAFMRAHAALFERRAAQGRVRDGHGDLHTGNVFLSQGVQVIDCIEFNERFRCLDVAEDIAFLAMDLDFFGRADLSRAFVSRYVELSGDSELLELLDFFKVYRAHVRAKVSALRLEQLAPFTPAGHLRAQAKGYFRLAHGYVEKGFGGLTCYLVAGLMGTGKTFLSRELARRRDLLYLSSDILRKELAGSPAEQHHFEDYGQGIYSPQFTEKTYVRMFDQAEEALSAGRSVVLDASFSKQDHRRRAIARARRSGARPVILECRAPEAEIRRRLVERTGEAGAVSDGRWELFGKQAADWEPIRPQAEVACLSLDTAGPKALVVNRLLEQLLEQSLAG